MLMGSHQLFRLGHVLCRKLLVYQRVPPIKDPTTNKCTTEERLGIFEISCGNLGCIVVSIGQEVDNLIQLSSRFIVFTMFRQYEPLWIKFWLYKLYRLNYAFLIMIQQKC